MIVKAAVVASLLGILLYALRELLAQRRRLRAEENMHALRLRELDQQVRFEALKLQQEQDKTLNAWSGTRKFRVDKVVPEAKDICSFYLTPHDGKVLPSFEPGQYLTFKLDIPGQPKPVIRCYSLSESYLQRDYYRVSIKKIPPPPDNPDAPAGLSSGYFHDAITEGAIVDCKAPAGNFYVNMAQHTPVVLIAGGIGITPMLSILRSIHLSGSKREVWLFYGVRNGSELVKGEELKQIDKDNENVHVRFCFNEFTEEEKVGEHYDFGEMISVALLKRVLPGKDYDYYICGPAPMMVAMTGGLADAGVPDSRVHFESFGPASIKKRVEVTAEAPSDQGHAVEFAKSGRKLNWTHQDGTLLELAESHGIMLDCGCRAGSCGTCVVAIHQGEVDYIDEVSAETEEGSCLACLAVPKTALVIDA